MHCHFILLEADVVEICCIFFKHHWISLLDMQKDYTSQSSLQLGSIVMWLSSNQRNVHKNKICLVQAWHIKFSFHLPHPFFPRFHGSWRKIQWKSWRLQGMVENLDWLNNKTKLVLEWLHRVDPWTHFGILLRTWKWIKN